MIVDDFFFIFCVVLHDYGNEVYFFASKTKYKDTPCRVRGAKIHHIRVGGEGPKVFTCDSSRIRIRAYIYIYIGG